MSKTTMHKVDLKDAEIGLAELIDEASKGEDVVITRGDGASFRIVPITGNAPRPRFGSLKGMIEMSDDFDDPLVDFDDYGP